MKKLVSFLAVTVAALLGSAPLLAHHGEANYDTDKVVSVKGTVSDFEFINPHTLITVDVKNDKGEIEKWACEARSPGMLVRVGGSIILQSGGTSAPRPPEQRQQHRPNRQTSGSAEPIHQNYPRPSIPDREWQPEYQMHSH